MSSNLNLKYEKDNIILRRNKTLELLAKGYQQYEISHALGVSTATTSLDCQWVRYQAQEQLEHQISEVIPYHYVLAVEGLRNVLVSQMAL
jgi:Trp operon repressor